MAGGSAAAGVPSQHRSSGVRVSSSKHGPACAANLCPRANCWGVASVQAAAYQASMASKPQGDGSSSCQHEHSLHNCVPKASPDGRVHLQSEDQLETGAHSTQRPRFAAANFPWIPNSLWPVGSADCSCCQAAYARNRANIAHQHFPTLTHAFA